MDYYYQYQYCFDVSRQLAERGEACLLRLSLTHARGGVQDEERVLTTAPSPSPSPSPLPSPSPSRWTCSSSTVSDCQKHIVLQYHHCWTFRRCKEPSARFTRVRTVEPPEEAKSQAQGFIGVVVLVGVYQYNYSKRCYCMMPPRHVYPKLCHLFFLKERVGARATTTQVARTHNTFTSNKF